MAGTQTFTMEVRSFDIMDHPLMSERPTMVYIHALDTIAVTRLMMIKTDYAVSEHRYCLNAECLLTDDHVSDLMRRSEVYAGLCASVEMAGGLAHIRQFVVAAECLDDNITVLGRL